MKVETYFGDGPPWEVTLEVVGNGIDIHTGVTSFTHIEYEAGYDRALKQLFQKFNDDILIAGVNALYRRKL